MNATPSNTPRLLAYGFTGERLRLEFNRLPGIPLQKLLAELPFGPLATTCQLQARASLISELKFLMSQQANLWRHEGFIHGDLSLRNTLVSVAEGKLKLWFIDWITDLKSFAGTPRFASEEVFRGHRSYDSDRYAIGQILCILEGYH